MVFFIKKTVKKYNRNVNKRNTKRNNNKRNNNKRNTIRNNNKRNTIRNSNNRNSNNRNSNKRNSNNRNNNVQRNNYVEFFGKDGLNEHTSKVTLKNKSNLSKIKTCNKVLVENEKKCNCFSNKKRPKRYNVYKNGEECKTVRNKPQCKEYKQCRDLFGSFMSNSEPDYRPEDWKDPLIEGSHNCYAYFLDDQIDKVKNKCKDLKLKSCGDLKPQPGHIGVDNKHPCSSKVKDKLSLYTCPSMIERVMCDNMENKKNVIKLTDFDVPCSEDYYKGVVVVDSGQHRKMKKGHTYHFYRQDSSGRWSHKPGTLPVEYVDASKKPIYVPHLADKIYNRKDPDNKDGIHYDKNCSYMCLPRNYKKNTKAI